MEGRDVEALVFKIEASISKGTKLPDGNPSADATLEMKCSDKFQVCRCHVAELCSSLLNNNLHYAAIQ